MSKFDAKSKFALWPRGRKPCLGWLNLNDTETTLQESFLYKYCKTHGWIATNIIVAIYFLFALGVFIVPSDILFRYEICREFVDFMKQYFPNIQIFSDVSPFKEEIEFYASYMWVIGLFFGS